MNDCSSVSVALEGPSCAGKTTLGHELVAEFSGVEVAYLSDYSDYVGGGRFLPAPIPSSLAEEERSLEEFLRIEGERSRGSRMSSADLILIDRSIHTLLAHCRALEKISGVGYAGLAERVVVQSGIPLWPDLVLYLDIPNEVARSRGGGRFAANSVYMDLDFNLGIRLYFQQLADAGSPQVMWLDGTLDRLRLRGLAGARVRELLGGQHKQKGAV